MKSTEKTKEQLMLQEAIKSGSESETHFREILENSLVASYKRNLKTNKYEYLSPVFTKLTGYTPDDMMALPLDEAVSLVHIDDRPEIYRIIDSAKSGVAGQFYQVDFRFKHKGDGRYRWLFSECTVINDVEGCPSVMVGSISDISNRKQTEEELRNTKWRMECIIQAANIGTWEWNLQTGETTINAKWAEIVGYSLSELEPVSINTWYLLVHPSDLEQSQEIFHKHFTGELPFYECCLLYTSPSPRDRQKSRMPSSA